DTTLEDSPQLRNCLKERDLLRTIRHRSVVEVIDGGILSDLGRPYLALEWLDGGELSRHRKAAPLSIREVIGLGILLCRGLETVHAAGVIHADIKPSNIMLRRRAPDDGLVVELEIEPVLVDFG